MAIRAGLFIVILTSLLALPAAAQRGAAYCNVTEIKAEQFSNGVRITIVADGELQWGPDFESLEAEGAIRSERTPWGISIWPTERLTHIPIRVMNARSKLGSAFVPVGKYPVSHVEISIPEWASEGVGLVIDIVNYLGWQSGEGDVSNYRYGLWMYGGEDRTTAVIAWLSDRFPKPAAGPTPTDLPSEVRVEATSAGLTVHAVNAKLSEVTNEIAIRAGFPVSTPADSDVRISLHLYDVSPAEALEAIAVGCGLSAGQRADGSWVLASGVGGLGGYAVSETRRVDLRYLRAIAALDLLPNFLLDYIHADPQGNAIVVTGPPWMCDRVAADLAKLDAPPVEVSLEVVAVEYRSERALARTLGLARFFGHSSALIDTLTGDIQFLWLPDLARGWDLLLDNLEAESSGSLRSRATVRVLNGHVSRVFAGQQRHIIIQQIQEGVTANILPVDIGASLEVQPRVGESEDVVLAMKVTLNNLSGSDPRSGLPVVSQRSVGASVMARDGETIAIAGLELAGKSREERRIPILGALPLVGGLFRAPSRSQSETYLCVFLTPHIVRPQVAAEGTGPRPPARVGLRQHAAGATKAVAEGALSHG